MRSAYLHQENEELNRHVEELKVRHANFNSVAFPHNVGGLPGLGT